MQVNVCILFSLLAFAGSGFAADAPKPDPLDVAEQACMDQASTTAAMVQCEVDSYQRWDRELNRVYGELRKSLDKNGQAALKESQQRWLAYRDAELKTIGSIYDAMQGTMYAPMRSGAAADLVKQRALELRAYANLFKPQDQQ